MNVRKFAIASLLTALSFVIPFAVFFKIIIPPFTATLGSHVPMFLSMFFGPEVAVMVGLGSALGFFVNLGMPVVGVRASMHIIVGAIGAKLIEKGVSFKTVALITAPIHGLLEALAAIPFIGFNAYDLLIVTCLGTILHHGADAIISFVLLKVLKSSKTLDLAKL